MTSDFFISEKKQNEAAVKCYIKKVGSPESSAVFCFNCDIWLTVDFFPKILEICDADIVSLSNLFLSSDYFAKMVQCNIDHLHGLVLKAYKVRPPKWAVLSNFLDVLENAKENLQFGEVFIVDVREELEKSEALNALLNDDVRYFADKGVDDGEIIPKKLVECFFEDGKAECSCLILAALFGAVKTFNYFVMKPGQLRFDKRFQDNLIDAAIIGGSFNIISYLNKLKLDVRSHWETAIKYQRLQILIWMKPVFISDSSDKEQKELKQIFSLALKEENPEVLLYSKRFLKEKPIVDDPDNHVFNQLINI